MENWTAQTKAAYLACAIDTDGWIGLRQTKRVDGSKRLTPNVGVTNQSKEFLERLSVIADVPLNMSLNGKPGIDERAIVTRTECWQSYWRSPIHVLQILKMAEPYLIAKRERAMWVIEFCESRISENGLVNRSGKPYDLRAWQLAKMVTDSNGRSGKGVEIPAELLTA